VNPTKKKTDFYTRCAACLGLLALLIVYVFFTHLSNQASREFSEIRSWNRWNIAVPFHLIHAVMLYYLAGKETKDVWWAMFLGTIGFAGGIYLDTMTRMEIFGVVSSFGLLTLTLAWGVLVFRDSSVE